MTGNTADTRVEFFFRSIRNGRNLTFFLVFFQLMIFFFFFLPLFFMYTVFSMYCTFSFFLFLTAHVSFLFLSFFSGEGGKIYRLMEERVGKDSSRSTVFKFIHSYT